MRDMWVEDLNEIPTPTATQRRVDVSDRLRECKENLNGLHNAETSERAYQYRNVLENLFEDIEAELKQANVFRDKVELQVSTLERSVNKLETSSAELVEKLEGSRKFADGLITEQTKLQTDLGNQSRTLAAVRGVRRNRLYVLYRDYDRRKFYVSADELDKALKES